MDSKSHLSCCFHHLQMIVRLVSAQHVYRNSKNQTTKIKRNSTVTALSRDIYDLLYLKMVNMYTNNIYINWAFWIGVFIWLSDFTFWLLPAYIPNLTYWQERELFCGFSNSPWNSPENRKTILVFPVLCTWDIAIWRCFRNRSTRTFAPSPSQISTEKTRTKKCPIYLRTEIFFYQVNLKSDIKRIRLATSNIQVKKSWLCFDLTLTVC